MTIIDSNGEPFSEVEPSTEIPKELTGLVNNADLTTKNDPPKTLTIGDIADFMLKQMEQLEHSKKVALDAFVVANQEVEKYAAKVQAAKTPYGREYHTKKLVKQRTVALRAVAIADELEQRITQVKEQVESLLEINKNGDEKGSDVAEPSAIEEAP